MQLLSCARAWERLSKLLDELLLVCEVSKVRAAPSPACHRQPGCLLSPASSSLRTRRHSASASYSDTLA